MCHILNPLTVKSWKVSTHMWPTLTLTQHQAILQIIRQELMVCDGACSFMGYAWVPKIIPNNPYTVVNIKTIVGSDV
jgi:hypothetical protein